MHPLLAKLIDKNKKLQNYVSRGFLVNQTKLSHGIFPVEPADLQIKSSCCSTS